MIADSELSNVSPVRLLGDNKEWINKAFIDYKEILCTPINDLGPDSIFVLQVILCVAAGESNGTDGAYGEWQHGTRRCEIKKKRI